ncbi:MAG: choice-of-anchor J domain-containing protein [Bacteroidia bacterium]|nr:choice-of-anchor J domain-containing protein [Bacteroidia bacterium]MDW8302363.1 choice-of-anchor J domain-containing protein [Bacteroidia bacterium]
MKNSLIYFALVLFLSKVHSQTVIFSENFNSLTPPNIPTGWTQHNVDGLNPHPALSGLMGSNAWVSTNNPFLTPSAGDIVMISCSYYSPAGTANDWLVTPYITIPSSGTTVLTWKARAYDDFIADGYLVKVITSGTDPSNYVTTTIATISMENGTWTERAANLSAWAGQTIRIAFQNNTYNMYLLGLNDIAVIQPLQSDAQVMNLELPKYASMGSITIKGTLRNLGSSNLTSATIYYSANGSSPASMTVSSINLAYGDTYDFIHTVPLNITTPGTWTIKAWAGLLNTGPDNNPLNDTATGQIAVVSSVPIKRAVLLGGTGAWCQFCPEGTVAMKQVLDTYPNAIGILAHKSDGMSFPDGDSILDKYVGGYPTGTIDYYKFDSFWGAGALSTSSWLPLMGIRLGHIVPAEVSGSHIYDPITRQLNVSVTATFRVAVSGDFRLNCYLVEDSVIGPNSSQYNQQNYYNTVVGHPYYGLGNPIIGYPHRYVLRACLGGPWGTPGSIPSTTTDGGVYTQNYTYTIPVNYDVVAANPNRMYLVYLIQEYHPDIDKRPIHNAMRQKLTTSTNIEFNLPHNSLVEVFPNPCYSHLTVRLTLAKTEKVQIRIFDLSGKEVQAFDQELLNQGEHLFSADLTSLPSGMYLMQVNIGNQTIVKKIEKQ